MFWFHAAPTELEVFWFFITINMRPAGAEPFRVQKAPASRDALQTLRDEYCNGERISRQRLECVELARAFSASLVIGHWSLVISPGSLRHLPPPDFGHWRLDFGLLLPPPLPGAA